MRPIAKCLGAIFVVLQLVSSTLADEESEALIDLLQKKGIISQEEVESLRQEIQATEQAQPKDDVSLPEPKDSPPTGRFYWNEGMRFESGDSSTFQGRLGGRIMWDVAAFAEDDDVQALPDDIDQTPTSPIGNIPAGIEFRRVRLYTSGELQLSTPAYYKLQLDFAGGGVDLKDVYVGLGDLPYIGRLQIGHFKEPFSLEELTSSKYITLMERAAPIDAFSPSRNVGALIGRPILDERATWAIGGFATSEDTAETTLQGNHQVTARITGLPFYQEHADRTRFLHLGLSGRVANPQDDQVRFSAAPEAHLAPDFVDTGTIAADRSSLLGTEAAFVCGPYSLQGEYFRNWVDQRQGDNLAFDGYSILGSWLLTGEQRPYDRGDGTFDRIQPHSNFSIEDGGIGAWELALRYSKVDLNSNTIRGGKLDTITGGLNWYLNPQFRVMWNYGYSTVDRADLEGNAHIFQTRLQLDF